MLDELNKLEELDKLIKYNRKIANPIIKIIEDSEGVYEDIIRRFVRQYVKLGYLYKMDIPCELHGIRYKCVSFNIISKIYYDGLGNETIIKLTNGSTIKEYLQYDDIYKFFIKTNEYKALIREFKINTL